MNIKENDNSEFVGSLTIGNSDTTKDGCMEFSLVYPNANSERLWGLDSIHSIRVRVVASEHEIVVYDLEKQVIGLWLRGVECGQLSGVARLKKLIKHQSIIRLRRFATKNPNAKSPDTVDGYLVLYERVALADLKPTLTTFEGLSY